MVRASAITKCKRRAPIQVPYGSGYIIEPPRYGKPDIFKKVVYKSMLPETPSVTAYYTVRACVIAEVITFGGGPNYSKNLHRHGSTVDKVIFLEKIDYPSLQEHRLGEPSRSTAMRWRFQELTFRIYTSVNGEYEVAMPNVTANEDDTLDALVNDIIVEFHGLEDAGDGENSWGSLPREEGFSFGLQYEGSSLFQMINTDNRQFGQRIQLRSVFRRNPHNVYELLWKEYDARGRECKNTFFGDKLYHIIDLTSETNEDEGERENEPEDEDEADTNDPPQTLGPPAAGDNIISLLSSSPNPSAYPTTLDQQ
ncbi:hypothetical protein TWF569_011332 [Orbilia oligospora]|uniref:Uncharacterized protein n=1 Tax=Orbilia oligospora TaxID=2813651 RepID=A0A7C8JQH3_ORBOL|nr:hypothetical protein TWF706_002737 [Orbilia oligospora]KAF3097592.1 hypothetical protein TWF103_009523 [Orbilia oligospora]KAF3098127.1 hypothetical protein TWF102_006118 [Orbilia oligospora]KAF3132782.1 hypothetical protein TWF703_007248 [Orbilia oligospora]KAF3151401.1 hypothetical protein TWF594_007049 [Orbilia oligospora]